MSGVAAKDAEAGGVTELSSMWVDVASFAAAVDTKLGKWLSDTHRISLSEFRALKHLSGAADKELRVNDLAQKTGLNQSSMTRLLSRLEAKELAYRDTCPDDGRGVYAVISETGDALVADTRAAYEERVRQLIGEAGEHFPEFDARKLGRAFQGLSELLLSA